MKNRNLVRNLLMVALLAVGIFAAGAESSYAQDRSGYIIGGERTQSGSAMSSSNLSTRSGYLVGGERVQNADSTQQNNEEESENFLDLVLEFLF